MRWFWRNVSVQDSFALCYDIVPGIAVLQVVSGNRKQ